ncbi:E3 ubiquitin-protein ligase Rnf220-like [Onthophagus taurus]|uniref:E3 ubiquitin-protein ligase Rnf220-like n=1 Tax=Onthophagus taurus TaxID=166361 RepID=UPI000C20D8AB|nr:E3 ubiquitin-protein ligase Rnf220-like [Onthophagus taurus]
MENEEELASTSNGIEESGRGCRNKKKQVDPTICPVCCVTLRTTEVDQHLSCEIDKLYKISVKSKQVNGKCSHSSPSDANGTENGVDKCWETYQKVRSNRQCRQKVKSRKRKCEEVICPICNKETSEDITIHVEKCLRQSSEESDENIDVEGYEEYEWAGQSRVRATSMLQGGVSSLGTPITTTDEDEDLVVDGDDSQIYGVPQYSEKDIILPGSDRESEALRKAVIGDNENIEKEDKCQKNASDKEDVETTDDPILAALKTRIRELESRDSYKNDAYKCLICMEKYKTPVISVCCWHVHCEICWLQTLGAKKLCPQCNMITSPSDLRRIYM